ncbi:MAG: hypothetical protein COB30_010900 [Ectothiorhodospiraceae bacterium]|nr:hypothetical protein [Ectothiorhodospiraceae bacterium]
MPLINKVVLKEPVFSRQRGAALIAAIFIITALAALGGLMTQLLVIGSEETIDEWYSSQALYAAESGIEWSVYNSGTTATDQVVVTDSAWFDVNVTTTNFGGGKVLYIITSIGTAGGTLTNPRTQRTIVVQYMP